MQTIGVENLILEIAQNIEGECTLCPANLLLHDDTYVFSNDEGVIAAYHKTCFKHMAVAMRQFFEQFGLPTDSSH